MNCESCGNMMDENGVCPTCSEAETNDLAPAVDTATIASPELPAKKKPVIAIAAVAVVAVVGIILAVVFGGGGKTAKGKDALYAAFEETNKVYGEEIALFVSGNEVFSRMEEIGKGSSLNVLDAAGYGTATIINDKVGKVLSLGVESPMLPMSLAAFFCDDKLVVSAGELLAVEAPTTMLGDEINAFFTKNGMSAEPALDGFNSIDVAYSVLAGGNVQMQEQLTKELDVLIDSFLEAATFEQSTGEITIGSAAKSCDVMTLSMDMKTLSNWCSKELLPWLREAEIVKNYFEMAASMNAYGDTYEDYLMQLDMIDEELKELAAEEGGFSYEFKAIKNVIVSYDCTVTTDSDTVQVVVSTTGEKYYLDDISVRIIENGEELMSFSMKGSHVNTNHFTSEIVVVDNSYGAAETVSANIDWDTKGGDNNFKVSSGGVAFAFTLRLDDKDVLASVNIPYVVTGSWRMAESAGGVTVPVATTRLSELDMMSLYSILMSF